MRQKKVSVAVGDESRWVILGQRWPSTSVSVLWSSRRNPVVTVELCEKVLSWMVAVVPTVRKRTSGVGSKDDIKETLLPLSHRNVRWSGEEQPLAHRSLVQGLNLQERVQARYDNRVSSLQSWAWRSVEQASREPQNWYDAHTTQHEGVDDTKNSALDNPQE